MNLEQKGIRTKSITVAHFRKTIQETCKFTLRQLNEVDEKERKIFERDMHRPGLALAGFTNLFTFKRVQILGNTETRFLNHQPQEKQTAAFSNIIRFRVPCIILTSGNKLPDSLIDMATEEGIPVFATSEASTRTIYIVSDFLDDQFSLHQQYHATMVDVYGVGILLVGKSGIGKSEIALDLVERGHGLVADDVVTIRKKGESPVLMARRHDFIDHMMEIRGLGVVDVRANFGIRAIRGTKQVQIIVELIETTPDTCIERLGLDNKELTVLDVAVPITQLPVMPGRNCAVIIEVVALNYLLKTQSNYVAAEALTERINNVINSQQHEENQE